MQAFDQQAAAELQAALESHRAGRIEQAAAAYGRLLERFPDHPDTLNLAGYLAHQMGDQDRALRMMQRSIVLAPGNPNFLSNLGKVQQALGQTAAAAESYRRAIALNPNDFQTHYNCAHVMEALERWEDAEAHYRQASRLAPGDTRALTNLGRLLQRRGRPEEAETFLRRALRLNPRDLPARNSLAALLQATEQGEEAERLLRESRRLSPDDPATLRNLAVAVAGRGNLTEAIALYRKVVSLSPRDADALDRLGSLLLLRGGGVQAAECFRRALEIEPDRAETCCSLAHALNEQGKMAEAVAACEQALRITPDLPLALSNLALIRKDQGRIDEAFRAFDRLVEVAPSVSLFQSNRFGAMNYSERFSLQEIYEESRRWGERFASITEANQGNYGNTPSEDRRLRIGYVSPDFRRHSVSCFFAPLLAAHDREAFEITCYAEVYKPDEITERLQSLADRWRETVGRSDQAIAAQVRHDEIDILVDLAGHTAFSRVSAFAYKAAPIQITWLGYPNTTGLQAMDFRLTDAIADPPGASDDLHVETLVRLENGFLCYEAPSAAPPVAPPPFRTNGYLTFGSFNHLSKVTPWVIGSWAGILQQVPESRLLLKSKAFADHETRAYVQAVFERHGITADRLELVPFIMATEGHLGAYERMDIALDPFPYNGTTTTCEALWMGVPVVTLRGTGHAGRVGASLLTRLGLDDLVAESADDYRAIAIGLANDPARLEGFRVSLRDRVADSPLCDAPAFAHTIETVYRKMWRDWCRAQTTATARQPSS